MLEARIKHIERFEEAGDSRLGKDTIANAGHDIMNAKSLPAIRVLRKSPS